MFSLENEYKSLLPRNAHGTDKAVYTIVPLYLFRVHSTAMFNAAMLQNIDYGILFLWF